MVENLPVPLDRRVWQEAGALRDAGYEVIVICPKMRGWIKAEEKLDGIQIYRHWISQEAGGFAGFFSEYATALLGEFCLAWKAWWRHRFKLIHLCNPPDLLFLVAAPFRLLGVRIIYDVHDLWPEMFEAKFRRRGWLHRAVGLAERCTYAVADVVLATNQTVRGVALRRGHKPPDRVFVVRTSPKIAQGKGEPDLALKKNKKFLIGYIGVLGDEDGVHFLIDAAHHLIRKKGRGDLQFLIMGTGPEYGRLKEQRDRLQLTDQIDLPGRVEDEFLFRALRTMDLGVSCDPKNAYNDACTMNKVLEYMAFGRPQVMFDLREGRASAGDAAQYVSQNCPLALAEAIEQLLSDPSTREAMGQRGARRFQEELNWERSVEQLLAAYGKALE